VVDKYARAIRRTATIGSGQIEFFSNHFQPASFLNRDRQGADGNPWGKSGEIRGYNCPRENEENEEGERGTENEGQPACFRPSSSLKPVKPENP
jgi:hypothetical protein